MALSAVIGALRVNLGLDSAQFQQGLQNAQKSLKGVGKSMQNVGRNMSVAVTAPIVGFGAMVLKAAGDFEQSMNRVKAVSGATGEELAALRNQAKELGATTQFSASEAADGMGFLAQAGFDANQIIGAMPGTLQLAAAAQMDLASAADLVSNVLSGYGKEVEELAHVNDVLVAAFTKSNTDLQQLGEAMKFAGPVASAAGVQFEEAAAAVGLMGNAGIQASMAGTSLRGAISRSLEPTGKMARAMEKAGLNFTDAAGRLLPLGDIIEQLEPHAEDAGLFMTLFGQRAGPAMAALVSQGSDALRGLTADLENSGGTAERIANAQMEGFNGAMKELASAFEALKIAIAESGLIDWAADAVRSLSGFLQEMSKTNPEMLRFGTIVAGLAAVIGPALLALGTFAIVVSAISAPVLAAVAAIAAIGAAMALLNEPIAESERMFDRWRAQQIEALQNNLPQLWEDFRAVVADVAQSFIDWNVRMAAKVAEAVAAMQQDFTGFVAALPGWFADLPGRMVEVGADIARGIWEGVVSLRGWLKEKMSGIADWIPQWVRERLGIQSPSKVFHEIGVQTMQGMANGVTAGSTSVSAAMQQTTDEMLAEINRLHAIIGPIQTGFPEVATAASSAAEQTAQAWRGALDSFTSTFRSSIEQGKSGWAALKDAALDALDQIVDKLLNDVLDAMSKVNAATGGGGKSGGGFLGKIGSALGSIFAGGGGGFPSVSSLPTTSTPGVTMAPGFASGGIAEGLAMVGERGRELINVGSPSRVFSNAETERMLGRGGRGVNFKKEGDTIVLQGSQATPDQLRRVLEDRDRKLMEQLQAHRELDGDFMGL